MVRNTGGQFCLPVDHRYIWDGEDVFDNDDFEVEGDLDTGYKVFKKDC